VNSVTLPVFQASSTIDRNRELSYKYFSAKRASKRAHIDNTRDPGETLAMTRKVRFVPSTSEPLNEVAEAAAAEQQDYPHDNLQTR